MHKLSLFKKHVLMSMDCRKLNLLSNYITTIKRWYSSQLKDNLLPGNHYNFNDWIPRVGLEVHAQIKSESKLFSRSSTNFSSPPNANVSFFDSSLPGTLPVINRRCVEAAIIAGRALGCTIPPSCTFDRKHYFYADLPAGFQITQKREPIAQNGYIEFLVYNSSIHRKAYSKKSILSHIQLEQDSGKSLHDEKNGRSLIDLNRAGIALLELVFEPDLNNGEEAWALVADLKEILQRLDVSSCNMSEGAMRVDANISVHLPGQPLGERTEVKNLNSMRSLWRAVDFEISRQIKVLEKGDKVVNETLRYDTMTKKTVSMRDKKVIDYRFMPEPCLPPLILKNLITVQNPDFKMPVDDRNHLINNYGLSLESIANLSKVEFLPQYFLQVIAHINVADAEFVVDFLLSEFRTAIEEMKIDLDKCSLEVRKVSEIIDLLHLREITNGTAYDILNLLLHGDSRHPKEIIKAMGWHKLSEEEVKELCLETIKNAPKKSKKYAKTGTKKSLEELVKILLKYSSKTVDTDFAKILFEELLRPKKESSKI